MVSLSDILPPGDGILPYYMVLVRPFSSYN